MGFAHRGAFTLIELLVVIAIMGLLGTMSAASYRSMQQAMQDNSAVRGASQFIRLAYQRSQIDRLPVNVYFWNEHVKAEGDSAAGIVVGRAIAVRRQGILTSVQNKFLIDEFGDLEVFACCDDEGEADPGSTLYENDAGMYLYRINGRENSIRARSLVSRSCGSVEETSVQMISYPDDKNVKIRSYGFYVQDGSQGKWHKGDAYGLEFGDFSLPNNYIFESSFSGLNDTSPTVDVKVFNFNPLSDDDGKNQTIRISTIRADAMGNSAAVSLGATVAPGDDMKEQNRH